MHHIVFLDRATLAPEVRLQRPAFAHHWTEHERTTPEQVVDRLRQATIAITNKVPLTAQALTQLPQLRLVAVAATGTDCVDKAACARQGVMVCNIRSYAVHTVPEHTMALMLALQRQLFAYRDSVRAGRWWDSGQFCYFDHPIADLAGSTLGLVGRGELGRRVAALAQAFGMQVLWAGRKGLTRVEPPYTPWDEVLSRCDVLSLHCPLTPETRHLLAEAEFRAMPRRPLIINTARGALIDEVALERALDEGLVSGAALDVASTEPPPPEHVAMRLAQRPNVILTPHVAWASRQAQQRLADQLIQVLEAFVAGRPMNQASH
ncbi:glycerate dehydrogenase [Tepidimonas fonticaldi]|uniref:Glycerate dehydrogenase n=1 Tax=Tepidimonas fonticaldi TaxID=1101373 RepID=A0A1A6DTE8_9BURK|nr:D-2-hydroxyacid dehydrogenase [Tepidimonas fonticaldi]OBS29956.1 glycerate dehydrogenase [Tepidimonas fonticaldi]